MNNIKIPKIVFIVPFRDRYLQKIHFDVYMKYILEDYESGDYEIYYSHQTDNRNFNRGAVKNIGFLAIKKKYPDNYKNISFIFNDIDTLPYKKNQLNFKTEKGKIKHFFGFDYALGGIISITGEDFEKLNGFPNLWGWGLEDNKLQDRAILNKINIDRSNFFHFHDKKILNFDKDPNKIVMKNPVSLYNNKNINLYCGLVSLVNLNFSLNNEFINILSFDDKFIPFKNAEFTKQNLIIDGNKLQDEGKSRFRSKIKMNFYYNKK